MIKLLKCLFIFIIFLIFIPNVFSQELSHRVVDSSGRLIPFTYTGETHRLHFSIGQSASTVVKDTNVQIHSGYINALYFDIDPPTSTIVFPKKDGKYNTLAIISGTASDDISGVGMVEISIKNILDTEWWAGGMWVNSERWILTLGTTDWSYNSIFAGKSIFSRDGYYLVRSRSTDIFGNIETPGVGNSFLIDTTPPTVNAGIDQSVDVGVTVNFSGLATDPTPGSGVDTGSFKWTFIEAGVTVTLTGQTPSYTFNYAGEYTVTLNVSDVAGNIGSDIMKITVGNSAVATSAWPMFRYDVFRSGRSPNAGPITVSTRQSELTFPYVSSSPAIGSDGSIYIGTSGSEGKFYSFTPTLRIKWSFDGVFYSSPAIGSDGTIYVGSHGGILYAFYENGNIKWEKSVSVQIFSSPVIGRDGDVNIYITGIGVGGKKELIKIDGNNGTIIWKISNNFNYDSAPSIGLDGTIYVTSSDGMLYVVNPDNGSVKWTYSTGAGATSSASIGNDGTIYFGAYYFSDKSYWIYAVTPGITQGTLKWKTKLGANVEDTLGNKAPTIGANNRTYIESYSGGVFAVDSITGSIIWNYSIGSENKISGSTIVGSDGTIYVGANNGKLYAINDVGNNANLKWSVQLSGSISTTPAIGNSGTIYIGTTYTSTTGYFYSIKSSAGSVSADGMVEITQAGLIINKEYQVPADATTALQIQNLTPAGPIYDIKGITGTTDITFKYDPSGAPVDETQLKIYHYSAGTWTAISTQSVDTVNNSITGTISTTTSLFAILLPKDTTSPITTIAIGDPKYEEAGKPVLITSNTLFTLFATDDIFGVKETKYKIDNGEWIIYTVPFSILVEGVHTISYYSIDKSDNEEVIKTKEIEVDITVPIAQILSPSKEDTGLSKYVSGNVKIIGISTDLHFDYYLLEYSSENTSGIIVDKTYNSVIGNLLGIWNTEVFSPGLYTLRLTGVDKVGNTATDVVTVFVGSPNSLLSIRDKFNHPDGISLDSAGYIYIADRNNDVVKKIDLSGRFIEIGKKELNKPEGVFIDKSDNIYIADRNGNEVRIYNSSLQVVKVLAGILNKAVAIVVDDAGNIYVADRNNDRLVRFNVDGSTAAIGEGILNKPEGIFLDKGNIYVLDRNNDCIRKFSNSGNLIETIGKGALNKPAGIFIDSRDNIFVSDTNNDRIVRFDRYRNIQFSLKTWNSPQGTVQVFNKPKGITIDRLGNLYVADSNNSLIEIFGENLPNVPSLEAIAKNNDDNSPEEAHKLKNDNVHAKAKAKNNEEKKEKENNKEKTLSDEIKEQRKKLHEDIERRREELGKDIKESRQKNKEELEKFREEAKQTKKELEEGISANRKELEKGMTRLNGNPNSNSMISNNNLQTNPVIIIKVEDAKTGEVLWKEGMDPLILHQGILMGKKPESKEGDKDKDKSGDEDKGKHGQGSDNKKPEESKDKEKNNKKPDEPEKGNSGGQGNQGNNGNNNGNNGNSGGNQENNGNSGNNNNQDKGKGKK